MKPKSISSIFIAVTVFVPALAAVMYVTTVKQLEAGGTPIVIDLNGNGKIDIIGHTSSRLKLYTLFSAGSFVNFDIDSDGAPNYIDWLKPNTDGFLINSRAAFAKGNIDGSYLFGNSTVTELTQDIFFSNGFERLAALDSNGDAILSGSELENLSIWIDDGDAQFKVSEMHPLSKFKIVEIAVNYRKEKGPYDLEMLVSHAFTSDNKQLYLEDIWFMEQNQMPFIDQMMARFFGKIIAAIRFVF